jgi:hypothetical protein
MRLKNFLFLQALAPAAGGPEAFDLALTAAAFDQEVTLLLIDDGVFWLYRGLPEIVCDAVEHIAIERESLIERALPLPDGLRLIDRSAIAAVIAAADVVVKG